MLDQMSAMYRDIQDAIEAGNPDRAQSVIEDFRQLLRSPGIEELPAIAKRRDVELFLLTILEDSLRGAREQEAGESSLLDTARLVRDVRAAVERAREAEQQGNSYDAARYYTRAIETITAVQNAHESMLEIAADRRRSTADERSTLAQEELSAGNTDEGLEMLVTAAAEAAGRTGETVRSIIDTITGELRGELASLRARRAELESEIASLEEELASLEDQNSTLEENLDTARSSRSELQDELRSLEQQNSSLNERIGELEQEQAELQREYRRARERVATLENDLEEAVDELAEFVSLTEDGRAPTERGTSESRAAEEYRRLVERSRDFTGGSAAEREAAREAFRSFLRSEEVRELFPRLPSIFQRLYGE
jgi:chromosome segregation ATPase